MRTPMLVAVAAVAALVAYHLVPRSLPHVRVSPEIIAHRGVHQNHRLTGLKNDTCTARLIEPPRHAFIENTIPSMAAAFAAGATTVELDIHPTTDDRLVVFHDWTLDCRTNGRGVTHEHDLAFLQTLDVGYGYTSDGGRTHPLRTKGVGLMPDFDQVLAAFPRHKLLVDQKDHFSRTITLFAKAVNRLPADQRKNIFYWNDQSDYVRVARVAPDVRKLIPSRREMTKCARSYALRLGLGPLPSACQTGLAFPANYLPLIPGWPGLILRKARAAGVEVFVIDVDTPAEVKRVANLPIDGIMTNRIETIGPLLRMR